MIEGEPVPYYTEDEWQEVTFDLFHDIWEQHGIGAAVAAFLTTLGAEAVESDTVGELIASMQSCVEAMVSQGGSATRH